jgi:hypothetical protein
MKKSTAFTKKCCKDEHKIVKLEKDHQKSVENSLQLAQMAAATPAACIELPQVYITSIVEGLPVSHAPPRSIKTHILYCNFRI